MPIRPVPSRKSDAGSGTGTEASRSDTAGSREKVIPPSEKSESFP